MHLCGGFPLILIISRLLILLSCAADTNQLDYSKQKLRTRNFYFLCFDHVWLHMDIQPHFFKIILPSTLDEKRISLPPKFVREYGQLFPTSIVLRLPNGEEWRVELTKDSGRTWLSKGWKQFAESYRLQIGHFIVFRYDRDSSFHVLIFDKSATEINYNQILQSKGEKPSMLTLALCPSKRKKSDDQLSSEKLEDPHFVDDENLMVEKIALSNEKRKISKNEKLQALERTSCFKYSEPFFKFVVQCSHLTVCSKFIPIDFARRFFHAKKNGHCSFSNANGRIWHATYSYGGRSPQVTLHYGWKDFARDNHLEIGDVCVFELIKKEDLSFKVSVLALRFSL